MRRPKLNAKEFAHASVGRVETRPFFLGIHEQPVFKKMGFFKDVSLPVTERIARQGLYLPSGQAITDEQIDYIIEKVRRECLYRIDGLAAGYVKTLEPFSFFTHFARHRPYIADKSGYRTS